MGDLKHQRIVTKYSRVPARGFRRIVLLCLVMAAWLVWMAPQ